MNTFKIYAVKAIYVCYRVEKIFLVILCATILILPIGSFAAIKSGDFVKDRVKEFASGTANDADPKTKAGKYDGVKTFKAVDGATEASSQIATFDRPTGVYKLSGSVKAEPPAKGGNLKKKNAEARSDNRFFSNIEIDEKGLYHLEIDLDIKRVTLINGGEINVYVIARMTSSENDLPRNVVKFPDWHVEFKNDKKGEVTVAYGKYGSKKSMKNSELSNRGDFTHKIDVPTRSLREGSYILHFDLKITADAKTDPTSVAKVRSVTATVKPRAY